VHSPEGRKILTLLELPPIPGSPKPASQDAKRSTSKLRLHSENDTTSCFACRQLRELPLIPGSPKTALQEANRNTSKLRLQSENDTMSCFACRQIRELPLIPGSSDWLHA